MKIPNQNLINHPKMIFKNSLITVLPIFVWSCLLYLPGFSQEYSAAEKEILKEARLTLDTLCSETFAGRGYVDKGHQKAADYLSERFKQMGLKPLMTGGVYQQKFPLTINLATEVALTINGEDLVPGQDVIVNRYSGSGSAEGKIVDCGYGLKPPKRSLEGKIAMFRDGWSEKIANDSERKKEYQNLSRSTDRVAMLMNAKPLAIIVIQKKLTAGFSREALSLPVVEVREEALSSKPRTGTVQVKAEMTNLTSQNVIGMVEGKQVSDTAIIISAHYDHLGKLSSAFFTGANDNASGTTMLLSMAEYFSKAENQPYYSMIFIGFGGEETGLIGSGYYVNAQPVFPLEKTKFILNLDLMGNGIEGIMAVGGKDFPGYFDQLVSLNDSLENVPVVRARTNAPNSDHYFFLENGVPGFFIYTLGGPPHYHDVNDNPSTIELSKYVEVRELLIKFLAALR